MAALSALLCLSASGKTARVQVVAPAAAVITTPVFVLNSLVGSVGVIDPANWTEIKRIMPV